MIRPILRYGDELLQASARPVIDPEDPAIRQLVDDMLQTMYAAPGIGLAAPQIGVAQRVFVIDLSVGRTSGEVIVMINPEFVERDGTQIEEEGCLSLPGFSASVLRPARVVCRGRDRDGRERSIEGTGLLARAFQHEMDHLEGRLFLDRLRGIKRDLIVRRIHKMKRDGRW
jgi:peptide deformylase